MRKIFFSGLLIVLFTLAPCFLLSSQEIPSPEEYYGFRMGADGELAHWNKITAYFQLLSERSSRVKVVNLGETTLGNPFLLAIFSSPENLENLDFYRGISRRLADPRGLSEEEIQELISKGKYVCAQSYSLHATEIGGTQCTSELAYDLVTGNDPTTEMILKNTIFLMIPCFNPDGQIMVTDWFYKYKGTRYNHTSLPYLYHTYTGHDNNRDGFQLTQKESLMFAKVIYREWIPQAFADHHQMGGSGARFYLPPYIDPIHPNVDPLIWREHQLYGAHMAAALDGAGKSGFETGVGYTGWVQALFNNTTNYHNIAGMLTESASANWADPIYVLSDQLRGTRGRPGYFPQNSMPRLWPGGWWRARDIVEQQIIASKAVLELGARYRETMLRNMVLKAQGNIQRGLTEPPYAYIIPKNQHDWLTAVKMAHIFQLNGIEIHRLDQPFRVGSRRFEPGSFVISCAQPKRVFVKSFLEQVFYPDNAWTRSAEDQSPLRPYDNAQFNMGEQMGVEVIPLQEPPHQIKMSIVGDEIVPEKGTVEAGNALIFEHSANAGFKAVNRLLAKGFQVSWIKEGFAHQGRRYAPGTMLVQGGSGLQASLLPIAEELGIDFRTAPENLGARYQLKPLRMGLYKRFAGGNMDEGWTNWMLQDFEFPFNSLHNQDIRDSKLADKYDVLIIPSDRTNQILNGRGGEDIPPEFRGGIGDEGAANIERFVKNGGTLITLDSAWDLARNLFDLPIQNTLEGISSKDFFCPGSTLKISVDTAHPLGFGMTADALALFRRSAALRVSSGSFKDAVSVPVRYQEEDILQSGWLIGEEYLSKKPAVLEFRIGKGQVIILAFPAQFRAQMHGTYKFLFNAIYYGPAEIKSGN